ncbi:hypothetical protein FOBRF1_013106 [Fusarium oxysporum]
MGVWQNSRLADEFPSNGYLTLLHDTFNGDPLPVKAVANDEVDIFKWLTGGSTGDNPHNEPAVDPIVLYAIKALREEYGVKKLGAVGYCFRAKYLVRYWNAGIDAGYLAHPSFVDAGALAAINGPVSIAAAETDHIFPAKKWHETEEILIKNGNDDIETQRQFEKDDPDALDWDGPEDPDNPMNWPPRKRTAHIILIALVQLVSNLASTMFAPAGELLMNDFDFFSRTLSSLSVSIYVLGFAVGPLIWAPLSEVYGRFPIYIISTIIFVGFVLGCAFSTSLAMFMVFRLLCGCGGAASLALSGGTLADLVPRQQRGKWMALIAIGPIMGPTIGPVVGGFVGQNIGWRWVFRLMAICVSRAVLVSFWNVRLRSLEIGALIPMSVFVLRETYAPVILLQRENQRLMSLGLPLVSAGKDVSAKLKRSILRPFKLLFLSPVVLFLALYAAFCFGLMFLLLTTFSNVFKGQYGFDMGITGLCYLGMGVGTLGGLIAQGKFSDKIMRKRAEQRGGEPKPEDRIPLMAYLSWTIPVGMFWYGWSTDEKAHWIVPIIGSAFVGIGFIFVVMPSMIYLVDCFGPEAAASALAAHTVLRSVTAAFLPLAGPRMYESLGLGWGNSLLAFLAIAMIPIPWYFMKNDYRRLMFEVVKGLAGDS